MPPFKDMSPVFSGEAVAALWDMGVGGQVGVVGARYQVPRDSRTAEMRSASVPACLAAILDIVVAQPEITCLSLEPTADNLSRETEGLLTELDGIVSTRGHALVHATDHGDGSAGPVEIVSEVITVREAARLLGVTPDAIRKRGLREAPGSRPGRALLVSQPILRERADLLLRLGVEESGHRRLVVQSDRTLGFYGLLAYNRDALVLRTGDLRTSAGVLLTLAAQTSQ